MTAPPERKKAPEVPRISTAAPARNFTITLAEHVRAAAGPPAFSVRKRRIEDLEDKLVEEIRAALVEGELRAVRAALEINRAIERRLRELARLIADHNRYYPIEANLPMDPRSGALLERGRRWEPLATTTLDTLIARALAAE